MHDVETYAAFGHHRSGGTGDRATTAWLAARFRALGLHVEPQPFDVPDADTTAACLDVDGRRFDGFAQPPLTFTRGVTAALSVWPAAFVPGQLTGKLVVIPPDATKATTFRAKVAAAEKDGAIGLIAVSAHPAGEIVAVNTDPDMPPGLPILTLHRQRWEGLNAAVAGGRSATLTIEGPGGTRAAANTLSTWGSTGPWVVVSTPQSGWFTCGGERGPGVAMALALATWATRHRLNARLLFLTTSGHEWADAGARRFQSSGGPPPSDTALWLHLGASFGARRYDACGATLCATDTINPVRTLMVSPDLLAAARSRFAGQIAIEVPVAADPALAQGELRRVLAAGYLSTAGFWGAHGLFHTPADTAAATSGSLMRPIVRACAGLIEDAVMARSQRHPGN